MKSLKKSVTSSGFSDGFFFLQGPSIVLLKRPPFFVCLPSEFGSSNNENNTRPSRKYRKRLTGSFIGRVRHFVFRSAYLRDANVFGEIISFNSVRVVRLPVAPQSVRSAAKSIMPNTNHKRRLVDELRSRARKKMAPRTPVR